jgi:hypothetical protein
MDDRADDDLGNFAGHDLATEAELRQKEKEARKRKKKKEKKRREREKAWQESERAGAGRGASTTYLAGSAGQRREEKQQAWQMPGVSRWAFIYSYTLVCTTSSTLYRQYLSTQCSRTAVRAYRGLLGSCPVL